MSLSATSSNPMSAQELRRKRLAALSGEITVVGNEASIASAASVTTVSAEVVDLCDSSDDERKPAAVASRSAASAAGYARVDSDSDDEELMKQFYAQKKRQEANAENGPPAKKRKGVKNASAAGTKKAVSSSTIAKKPTTNKQATRSSQEDSKQRFQVATWNVWFGPPNLGGGEPHASARMKALARHLLQAHDPEANNPLLCIGFQEVIDELAVHLFPLLEHAGYQVIRQPGAPYGCALAIYTCGTNSCTMLDASFQPYQVTNMGRGFLYARIQLPFSGNQVLFCTTHLESWIGKDHTGARERLIQLKELEAFCNAEMKTYSNLQTAIITGDMNWDDERPRATGTDPNMTESLQTSWTDSFLATRQDRRATCYTYDGKLNPMLGGNLRRRFDRCLVRNTSSGQVETTGTQLVGTGALVGLTWQKYNPYKQTYKEVPTAPSDHFGLMVQMTT